MWLSWARITPERSNVGASTIGSLAAASICFGSFDSAALIFAASLMSAAAFTSASYLARRCWSWSSRSSSEGCPIALMTHCSKSMSVSLYCAADAATFAVALRSAPIATKLVSPSVDLRATYKGPVNVLPLTFVTTPSPTNSSLSGRAPTDAFQGNPLPAAACTSDASGPAPEMTPASLSEESPIVTSSAWPTTRDIS